MNARIQATPAVRRCAIYTRKSSDEGLEQSFNSLHAQREACEAYIRSQAHEGWSCRAEAYDDGGFSGGSMERPGLARLLADVVAGHVDVVVVYKIDRLTRSLTDFAKIVDTLDAAGASFASITQPFNSTTSMGRLTLNVLLSFAQFEREVTGERIRDKIAQSKAKGMWMGGVVPLGYDAGDHTLVVNAAEAELVRHIFQRYLKLGSVHALRDELERQGIRSKAWVTKAGRAMGGRVFSRGALFHLLQNPHYIGRIRHRDETHPSQHPAIVEEKLFAAVQARLEKHRITRRERPTRAAGAALTGRIFDSAGRPYSPAFSYGRSGRRYGYYVRGDIQQGRGGQAPTDAPARLPIEAVDAAVLAHLARLAGDGRADWTQLGPVLLRIEVRGEEHRLFLDADALFGDDHPDLALEDLKARLLPGERLAVGEGTPASLIVAVPGRLQFRGGRTWRSRLAGGPRVDPGLVRAIRGAHQILSTVGLTPGAERREGQAPADAHARKLCRLAFLAPNIQAAVLAGAHPGGWSVARLLTASASLSWEDQCMALGFGAAPP